MANEESAETFFKLLWKMYLDDSITRVRYFTKIISH